MASKEVAPKISIVSPPSGSIVLDELLRKYLIYIGLRKFKTLSFQEIKQFALLTVYRMVKKYGLKGLSVEQFWNWIQPGEAYTKARLLPDTELGCAYHVDQLTKRRRGNDGEETVILRGVDNVRLCSRRVFINLIFEEMRVDKKQETIKGRVQEENRSSVRRGQTDQENHQPLDEILRNIREQREGANLEAVRFVMRRVEEEMPADDLHIVQLLNDGHKPQDLATALHLDVTDIYTTYRVYKTNCKNLWSRLFGPS
jgi:hypothetical protein